MVSRVTTTETKLCLSNGVNQIKALKRPEYGIALPMYAAAISEDIKNLVCEGQTKVCPPLNRGFPKKLFQTQRWKLPFAAVLAYEMSKLLHCSPS